MTDPDPAAHTYERSIAVLADLRARYPGAKFLALGQTVWWDEPMKAVLRRMLDESGLGGTMVLGVHDTDYFAKSSVRQAGQSRFELMPHNDGTTRDLWSAAGEISRLFGSETFPTRHDFIRYHVPFGKLAAATPDPQEFVDETTEAWGWRGLVYTGSRDLIVHDLPLADMGGALQTMLAYGFDGTRESIVDNCCRDEARALAGRLLEWTSDFCRDHTDCFLSNLYRDLFPRLFELLLGAPPREVEVDCTAHLLRLTPDTAGLPRFAFADLFLREETRALAARAYNEAVAGSEIYTLDRFGLGALPFDVVLPKHGRGTLRVTLRAIHIETREPIRIPLRRPIDSIHELAAVLTREFGDHVTLVGKAVALVSMLAREFIFVFNEEGSGYVTRTRRMNDILRAAGVPVEAHPILRLRYRTWDALAEAGATLALPDHLAAAFGQRQIPSRDFAAGWQHVVMDQGYVLDVLKTLTRPRDLMTYLAEQEGGEWSDRVATWDEAKARQRALRETGAEAQARIGDLYRELSEVKRDIVETERQKGEHFRATTEWTEAENARRAGYDARVRELLNLRRSLVERIRALKTERLAFERGSEATAARADAESIEQEAALARLRLVRIAILTRMGLVHTQHRPSAWWLPMVDPSGRWFARVAATTEAYVQELVTNGVDS